MQTPAEISFRNTERSEFLEADIRERIQKLEEFFDGIVKCRVVVELPHKHQHQGGQFEVRIQLTVPRRELVADRHAHEDAFIAVREAFDAIKRQLEDYVRELRGQVKHHDGAAHGRVLRLFPEASYGFIITPDDREVYFHANSLVDADFNHLESGAEVRFVEEPGEKGPQASTVHLVGHHHHANG
ncbi:MAG TPA: HPF/RaiA family ribosome-associated protein [Planctomycetaceae bacterium]|nr:HPF/RaiA family ribosome-associated protein [Planctomycetaceae bacterium]